jgi:hypothetical protein
MFRDPHQKAKVAERIVIVGYFEGSKVLML